MKKPDSLHVLIIGKTLPEPQSSAAGSRMMQLISLFKSAHWQVTFACPGQGNTHTEDLKNRGISVEKIYPNTQKTNAFLKQTNPDVVLFDRFMMEEQFGWRVAEYCPDALRVLDTEDLHFLRHARQNAVKQQRSLQQTDLYNKTAKREIAAILRSDVALIISEFEQELLLKDFKLNPDKLCYLPFLVNKMNPELGNTFPGFDDRQHFMFVGNFLHQPNVDAVYSLKNEVWPLIHQQLPEAELHIYGAYTAQKIKQLAHKADNFLVKGRAENINQTFQAYRVLLAPLRYGAGLKGKFVDAMQNDTPCVTTPIGAEGLCGNLPFNGAIEQNPEAIAKAAISLYTDREQWKNAQKKGVNLINSRFDKALFEQAFLNDITNRKTHLKAYRKTDFTGQMLRHHRLQSTKYMARWIEAKNKLKDKEE